MAEIATGIVMLIVSSLLLTMSIEEIGKRGRFSESFTGAVISPIFTALPELVVIVLALLLIGSESGSEIAAGTIIGEPFMVSAIGFPAVAMVLLAARKRGKVEDVKPVLSRTLVFMGLIFPIMLIPWHFNSIAVKVLVSVVLVLLYYVFFKSIRGKENLEVEATVIRIRNKPLLWFITGAGVVLLLVGSTLLVRGINGFYLSTGVSQELITILLVPIGTIVPETLNAVIWAHRGKTSLAIGAMAGEEMYFATFFPALGILASRWVITFNGVLAIVLTSSFSIVVGLLVYRFRSTVYIFILYLVSLVIFLMFVY